MAQLTVKARARHGTRSLDLTIPAKVVKESKIEAGDVFVVEISRNRDGEIILSYKRIFGQTRRT